MIQQARRDELNAIAVRALMGHFDVQISATAPHLVVCGACGACGAPVAVDFDQRADIAIDDGIGDDPDALVDRVLGIAEMMICEGEGCDGDHASAAMHVEAAA